MIAQLFTSAIESLMASKPVESVLTVEGQQALQCSLEAYASKLSAFCTHPLLSNSDCYTPETQAKVILAFARLKVMAQAKVADKAGSALEILEQLTAPEVIVPAAITPPVVETAMEKYSREMAARRAAGSYV